mmetsp:Transcript_84505/g.273668  ORF Transcript_84505/g.273668 Transcript_84505/m.273668 type:complete len:344 (-) Transcript_84505:977-2008(-)
MVALLLRACAGVGQVLDDLRQGSRRFLDPVAQALHGLVLGGAEAQGVRQEGLDRGGVQLRVARQQEPAHVGDEAVAPPQDPEGHAAESLQLGPSVADVRCCAGRQPRVACAVQPPGGQGQSRHLLQNLLHAEGDRNGVRVNPRVTAHAVLEVQLVELGADAQLRHLYRAHHDVVLVAVANAEHVTCDNAAGSGPQEDPDLALVVLAELAPVEVPNRRAGLDVLHKAKVGPCGQHLKIEGARLVLRGKEGVPPQVVEEPEQGHHESVVCHGVRLHQEALRPGPELGEGHALPQAAICLAEVHRILVHLAHDTGPPAAVDVRLQHVARQHGRAAASTRTQRWRCQ